MDLTVLRKLQTDIESEITTVQVKLDKLIQIRDSISLTVKYVGQLGMETIAHTSGFTKLSRKRRWGRGVVKEAVLGVLSENDSPVKLTSLLRLARKAMNTDQLTIENLSGHMTRMTRSGDVKRGGQFRSYTYQLPDNQ
jgi:hypothetical protein